MHTPRKLVLAGIGALFVTACQDNPTTLAEPVFDESDLPTYIAAYDGQDDISESFKPRIVLDVSVVGDLVPHATVSVQIEGWATAKLTGGDVRATLPTMAAMGHGSPDRLYYPADKPVPAAAEWQLPAMDEGTVWKQSFEIRLPDKGYYHVAIAAAVGGPDDKWDQYLLDDTYGQAWLLVVDDGGFATDYLDESVFGDDLVPQPGLFQTLRTAGTGAATGADMDAADGDEEDDSIAVHVVYWATNNYVNAKDAELLATYVSQSDEHGYTIENVVQGEGAIMLACPGEYEYINAAVRIPTTDEVNAHYGIGGKEFDQDDCGETLQLYVSDAWYIPWKNLNEVIPRIEGHFGQDRGQHICAVPRPDRRYQRGGRQDDLFGELCGQRAPNLPGQRLLATERRE